MRSPGWSAFREFMMNKALSFNSSAQRGFAYAEVLLSVALLAILLVPAMQALTTAISGSSGNVAARQLALRSKMEEVLSQPFSALYAETWIPGNNTGAFSATFSDPSSVPVPDRRAVVLYRYDPATNALSSTDTGLLFVSAYYEADGSAHALNTLAGRWW